MFLDSGDGLEGVVGRYDPTPDMRQLLAKRGLTVAAAERASRLYRGSLSRLLAGRRGRRLSVEMVTRLSKGLRKPFEVVRAALELSIAVACERRRLAAAAERARALLE
jgi:hypothetical protein